MRLAVVLAALALSACAAGSGPRDRYARMLTPTANPSKVVAAELGFARAAREDGQWTAFRELARDEAVMFVPEPVAARDWLANRADPSEAVRWQPHHVWSSCDGSLAVTRGAWQSADGSQGYFTNVWQRDSDGDYRWTLNQGEALDTPVEAPEFVRTDVAECPARGLADELRTQAEQSRPVTGGTYFDQVSSDSSLFLTFVVSPDLSRHWKLMLYRDGHMVDAMAGSAAVPQED
ncbi:hypothetical protein CHH26_15335 [Qipengyuania flava]|uniref:hypothetical protein n=1 Tax=Qipengyuania flava TaxID=192812 RepID=UPI000B8BFB73|nr:hypothetical protein [Qipengyuania flava]ASP31452.1 hypothetical protein CHH26_15335 [Qipengyuania flava]